jgi:subtilisin family serine protease
MGYVDPKRTFKNTVQTFMRLGSVQMSTNTIRHYVALRGTPGLRAIYAAGDLSAIIQYIAERVFRDHLPILVPFTVADLPSFIDEKIAASTGKSPPDGLAAGLGPANGGAQRVLDELVVALNIIPDALETVREAVLRDKGAETFFGIGVDVPFAGADHWCPREAADPIFATRSAAEELLGVDYLRRQNGTTGTGVNVVIVDQGLDANQLGNRFGGGWPAGGRNPGATPSPQPDTTYPSHGMKVAHNILKVAPDVKLFDLPVLPPRILNIPAFLSQAEAAYVSMLSGIAQYRANGTYPGPWVVVNAWAIYDSRLDPTSDYTDNPDHLFNQLVDLTVDLDIDVVFGAGNCGQFCPDDRCGPQDRGPGRSIFGANSLAAVLTVGAVRADTMWLGYSSQGPGQPRLAHDKPDLCAASQFCEDDDAHVFNTGTSTACALTAGVVAALRSNPGAAALTPAQLKDLLTCTARKTEGPGWNNRIGHGILDARAAFNALP